MREIFARYPERPARLLRSSGRSALSPKLDNLVAPFTEAAYDTIFMKDADAVLEPDDLTEHMRQLTADVGLVCAIPYGADAQNLAAQIEASIFNGPHVRMLSLASCLRQSVGVGKIMLFRRGDFLHAGGFPAMAHTVGEDNAFSKAMARIGLRTVFSHRPVRQELGRRNFADVYQRQLRWSVIRRGDALLSLILEPLSFPFPAVIAAYGAAPLLASSPAAAAGSTLALWLFMESLLSLMKGWGLSWTAPVVLPLREATMAAVWLHAWTTSKVVWAQEKFEARPGVAGASRPSVADEPLAARKKG
jgi:ceramide glucosyltransferase